MDATDSLKNPGLEPAATNIYLVGMPGSGKTATGKRLAKATGLAFADLDARIAEHAQMPVPEIFARYGEEYFRKLESEQLRQTAGWQRHIIATGGGTPCFLGNMAWMNRHGLTLFLDVPLDELVRRLTANAQAQQKRPLFAGKSVDELTESLSAMLQTRLPFYETACFRLLPHQTDTAKIVSFLKQKAPQLFGREAFRK